jgi:hypothetical protein
MGFKNKRLKILLNKKKIKTSSPRGYKISYHKGTE